MDGQDRFHSQHHGCWRKGTLVAEEVLQEVLQGVLQGVLQQTPELAISTSQQHGYQHFLEIHHREDPTPTVGTHSSHHHRRRHRHHPHQRHQTEAYRRRRQYHHGRR